MTETSPPAELGYNVAVEGWGGFAVPAATPTEIVEALVAASEKAIAEQDIKDLFASKGYEHAFMTGAEADEYAKAQLDYFGTLEGQRGSGLGTKMLNLLAEHYRNYRGIFGEAEGVFSPDPEEAKLQQRRLDFYSRNGFRYGGYDCALFGVHYLTLIRGNEDVTAEELLDAHQRIYKSGIPPKIYDQFIQIPLREGEEVRVPTEWNEE